MSVAGQDRYLEIKVQTATPGQLVSMLYAGAIRFAKLARESIEAGELEKTNHNLLRVEAIVEELNITLDLEKGGEVASNLRRLYNYLSERLIQANLKKSKEIVVEVIGLLESMQETWSQVLQQTSARNRPYLQTAKATTSSFNIAVE
jgi:flagellar protein FliS